MNYKQLTEKKKVEIDILLKQNVGLSNISDTVTTNQL